MITRAGYNEAWMLVNCFTVSYYVFLFLYIRQPASAKWYDRRDSVFVEFCVEDSKDVQVNFDKSKMDFR